MMKLTRQLCIFALLLASTQASATRLMDLADITGVRSNQLVGYGLVVGLQGTGDRTSSTRFTSQSMKNMLRQLGVQLPTGVDPTLKNVAAVTITAKLPPFASPGQLVDVTVSSIGDAKSLKGGTLLMSQLKGVDGTVYAIAQGSLMNTGIQAEGRDGSNVTVNVPTVARIPDGAIIERSVPSSFSSRESIVLNLRDPSFTTAGNIVEQINNTFGPNIARAENGARVEIEAPADPSQRVAYMSVLERMNIDEGDARAKVIINSRTGTVVMNEFVRVKTAAVSHGSLVVSIREDATVSQPVVTGKGSSSKGQTKVIKNSEINIDQGKKRLFIMSESSSLQDVVNAINKVGATPSDLMSVLQALKEAGALQAELVVI